MAYSNIQEVQQFLGFASYYRKFIQNFAHVAQPMHKLTEHSMPFVWTDECQNTFDELRRCLTSTPILAYPDFSSQFILDTDASNTGIGAVPSQVNSDGYEQVIGYGSRLLTKSERQCYVTRRELLAVVTFTHQYRAYLTGQRFLLRTDDGSLTWLCNLKEPEGQLARWLERDCSSLSLIQCTGRVRATPMRMPFPVSHADNAAETAMPPLLLL